MDVEKENKIFLKKELTNLLKAVYMVNVASENIKTIKKIVYNKV